MKQNNKHKDYIIIGAGPGGLQLGYFFQKRKVDFLILEKNKFAGSYFKEYPRHRKLISINKIYTGFDDVNLNLRFDWNSLLCDNEDLQFKHYSKDYFPQAETYVNYLEDFADNYKLPIDYNVIVTKIDKGEKFMITTEKGISYTCNYLIVATGWTKPFIPEIPGIEHAVHYMKMSLNKELYKNKRVLILGKGNSAFETADDLISVTCVTHICSANPIIMAWNSHYVGNLRAINNNFLDTYHLKSQNAILDADIKSIIKDGNQYKVSVSYNNLSGEVEELIYDEIILCTGFKFDTSIFSESCKPNLTINNRFPNQTSEFESTNVKDLYIAGTLTHMRDYKKQASGFIHGFRYNASCLAKILNFKNHNVNIPSSELKWETDVMCEKILNRINSNSSLWNQYGFLGDVATINDDKIIYHESLPVDYINEKLCVDANRYFIITLEFGKKMENGEHTSNTRVHRDDFENAENSAFIHPVIRYYANKELVQEFHIIEDLEAVWNEPIHIEPLKKFLQSKQ